MVIRHDLLSCCLWDSTTNLEEVVSGDAHQREIPRVVLFLAQH